MKDAEDEAFDELAKRQGHWGGGYHAKRQMAADKFCDANCVWTDHHPDCNMVADKLQEPVAWAIYDKRGGSKSLHWPENHSPDGDATKFDAVPLYTAPPQPAQEPVARVTGMSFGRFIVEPLNPAMVLPVGMALYSLPQKNK